MCIRDRYMGNLLKNKVMGKFLKPGRIVVVLNGRFAGRKGIIVKNYDEGTKERRFGHCLVVGINRYPRKVTKRMNQKKIDKRTRVKPFIRYINYNHLMPTRYQVTGDLDFKNIVPEEKLGKPEERAEVRKSLSVYLKDRYRNLPAAKGPNDKSTHTRFFFKKLRF
eukprot:TRINITY_DN115_c0_g1_i6.p2 TRINITY_DN115_c0_g1~~TRINITY_DN115_c0_g1_i6.p2  ORF type:complete len:165 (+),score=50.23 TRINITY_DN115_c0_g1_i6:76-570(+)